MAHPGSLRPLNIVIIVILGEERRPPNAVEGLAFVCGITDLTTFLMMCERLGNGPAAPAPPPAFSVKFR